MPASARTAKSTSVVPYNSVPLVYRNVVVVGANTPPGTIGGIGNARAFDARTGAKLWEFSSVPQPGDVGHDTWEGDSWKGRLGANAWPFYFTLDEQRGLLYLPLASPIAGAYGGDRKGANLFGNSVVAVDVQTGKYKWHFQTIHHDLWDADPPAPPGLFDIVRNGRTIPALGADHEVRLPVHPESRDRPADLRRRRAPGCRKSDVPGELAFPTQPIPVKPPPLARVSYKPEDLVTAADTTPEHAKACAELVAEDRRRLQRRPVHAVAVPRRGRAAADARWCFPGGLGGANWGGTAFDPDTGLRLRRRRRTSARSAGSRRREEGSPVPVRQDDARPRHLRRPHRRRELAVPETAMGPPDGGQRVDRRHRVADAARHHRAASRGQAEHRTARAGRSDRDRRRRVVHRLDRRQPLPRARREDRQGAVGDQARAARQRQPDHLSGQERQAVRRGRRHRHAGGLRVGEIDSGRECAMNESMREPVVSAPVVAPSSSLVSWTQFIYGLHAFSLLTGILGAATIVGAFLTGWPSIIAVILNYVKRGDVRGTWLESHFRWQIRTFWFGLLWVSLCVLFVVVTFGIGILIAWLPIGLVGLWFIYRIIRGWMALSDRRPMYT